MADFNEPLSRNEAILQNILGASNELLPPQSRVEAILQAILNNTAYTDDPQSVIEELLLAIKNSGEFDKETKSRNEKILLAKLNGEPYTDEPQSRIEELLIQWLETYVEKTATGARVTLTDAVAGRTFVNVFAKIKAIQDLHGYDYPWAAGNGKNKFEVTATSGTNNGITYTVNADGTITANNTATANSTYLLGTFTPEAGKTYIVNGGTESGAYIQITYRASGGGFVKSANVKQNDVTLGSGVTGEWDYAEILARVNNETTVDDSIVRPMIRENTESDSSFAPYENICPINGRVGGVTFYHSGENTSRPTLYSFAFPSEHHLTVYGGIANITKGILTVTHNKVEFGTLNWTYNSEINAFVAEPNPQMKSSISELICSAYKYVGNSQQLVDKSCAYTSEGLVAVRDTDYATVADFELATQDVQLVYLLSTPITYEVDSQEIIALSETNNLWADTGEITVTYLAVE